MMTGFRVGGTSKRYWKMTKTQRFRCTQEKLIPTGSTTSKASKSLAFSGLVIPIEKHHCNDKEFNPSTLTAVEATPAPKSLAKRSKGVKRREKSTISSSPITSRAT